MLEYAFSIFFIVAGCYITLGAILNFRGFGFKRFLAVEKFRRESGELGARLAMLGFGVGFFIMGLCFLNNWIPMSAK
jgi:hypothetical protein